jgi:hypothetical protein
MAENKKSFVLYTDNYGLIKQLPDEIAGKLFKHIFAYVNDENPISDDLLLNIAFEPIKMALKRDLKKYEIIKEKRSIAGKKSAEQRQQNSTNSTHVDFVQQTSTNPTVSDSVSDSDSVSVIVSDNDILLEKETKKNNTVFDFKKSLINYGFNENLVDDWLKVRKTKKATNTKTAFDAFINEIESRGCDINEMLQLAVTNSWSGFKHKWVDNLKIDKNGVSKSNTEIFQQSVSGETARSFKY